MRGAPGLDPFVAQTSLQHLAVVVGGLCIGLGTFFGTVSVLYDGIGVFAGEGAISAQRTAGLLAGIVVWGYFGVAFVRGYGAPVVNVLIYPPGIVFFAPVLVRWVLIGPDIDAIADRFVGLLVIEPAITAAMIAIPGLGTFTTILALWARTLDADERDAWAQQHLSPAFYAAYVDDS